MISCATLPYVRRHVSAVNQFAWGAADDTGPGNRSYFRSLQSLQKHPFTYHADDQDCYLEFDLGYDWVQSILTVMSESDEENATPTFTAFDHYRQRQIAVQMRTALEMLWGFDQHVPELVKTLVGCVLFARLEGYSQASLTGVLGLIWISPQDHWRPERYAEAVLHETVHQATFLDEMVNRPFAQTPAQMAEAGALITSPIRNTKRPYDRSFHAICVSAALVDFYEHLGMEETALGFLLPALGTLEEMRNVQGMLTAHGESVLQELEQSLHESRSYKRRQSRLAPAI